MNERPTVSRGAFDAENIPNRKKAALPTFDRTAASNKQRRPYAWGLFAPGMNGFSRRMSVMNSSPVMVSFL